MYGAIIGDIVGSKYEFDNIKTKDFPFVSQGCGFTDDTVMTVAVARALLDSLGQGEELSPRLIHHMRQLGRRFPDAGYGGMFSRWLEEADPRPYNSFGNGAAMRASPCGLIALSLEEALALAKASAEVTHDHPEGTKGAQATAAAVYLAKTGSSREAIGACLRANFYPLTQTLDEIRPAYRFNETCQDTVPQALTAFLESHSFEDAIRNAISLGGDSDTLAAITGAVAWAYYRRREAETGEDGATPCGEGPADQAAAPVGEETAGCAVAFVPPLTDIPAADPLDCEGILTRYAIDSFLPPDFVETIRCFHTAARQRGRE